MSSSGIALLLASQACHLAGSRGFLHRGKDSGVSTAAAETSVQRVDYLCVGRLGMRIQQRDRAQYHARHAVTALHGALVQEGLLHTMKIRAVRQTLNSSDLLPVGCT